MTSTTTRYKANTAINLELHQLKESDLYQYGCEVEFYIDLEKYDLLDAIDQIKDAVLLFSDVDILVDQVTLPNDEDKNHCVQIKPDNSLEDHGIEISIPITSKSGLVHYLKHLLPLIEQYGYTNSDTGLHFHISTIDRNGANFDFYTYMLICHDKKLLSSWQPRIGFSQNVMDILSQNSKIEARKIKTKKGSIWNLEKVEANHIEIKSIGGENYHQALHKIIEEFNEYADCFDTIFKNKAPEYIAKLKKEHKKQMESLNPKIKEQFSIALNEAGLI